MQARRAARRAGKGKSSRHKVSSDATPQPSPSSSSRGNVKKSSSVSRVKNSSKGINVSLSDVPRISGRAPEPPQVVSVPAVVSPNSDKKRNVAEESERAVQSSNPKSPAKQKEEAQQHQQQHQQQQQAKNLEVENSESAGGGGGGVGGEDADVEVLEERLKQNRRLSQMLAQSLTPTLKRKSGSRNSDGSKDVVGNHGNSTISPDKIIANAKKKNGDDDSELETLSTSSDSPDEDYSRSYATAVLDDDLPKPVSSHAESSYDDSVGTKSLFCLSVLCLTFFFF